MNSTHTPHLLQAPRATQQARLATAPSVNSSCRGLRHSGLRHSGLRHSGDGWLSRLEIYRAELQASQSGAVFVEYVIVLVLVSAMGVSAIIPLGVALSHYFKSQQTVLTLPFP